MKFQFNPFEPALKLVKEDCSVIIPGEWQFIAPYGGSGFLLDPDQPNHWIIFSLCREQIQAFYKFPQPDGSIIYYRREIVRPTSGIIEIEFTEWDRVEKRKGEWVQKYPHHV